jgi:plastocyanin
MFKSCLVFLLLSISLFAYSGQQIVINVTNNVGKAVPNLVVYLTANQATYESAVTDMAIMDQINTQFLPHILPVQKDTRVHFPNSDSIKHHVYSFSAAKVFELQLYKDLQSDPMLFAKTGLVELGCNVHDWMLGYIYVVDTPFFGMTDSQGNLAMVLPDGDYQLDIWSPRIQDDLASLSRQITMPNKASIKIVLNQPMLPELSQYQQGADEFSDYE